MPSSVVRYHLICHTILRLLLVLQSLNKSLLKLVFALPHPIHNQISLNHQIFFARILRSIINQDQQSFCLETKPAYLMQSIDSLPLSDLVLLRIQANQDLLIAPQVPDVQKKDQLKKSSASVQAKKRKYYWTLFEQRRYIKFLSQNMELCSLSINERKAKKANHLMSKRVKTRNPAQCHTHHQKMLEKHKDIPTIIQHHLHLLQLSISGKSDTSIIELSQQGKHANQIRQWKSVDEILMNSGLYQIGERRSEKMDRGEEIDFFSGGWMQQGEWIEW